MTDAAIPSPTTARITYCFPVLAEYLNPAGTLHGGQQAAFYDVATSWLLYLVRRKGSWTSAGTSRSLTVTYLRPAVLGEGVIMECEVKFPFSFFFRVFSFVLLEGEIMIMVFLRAPKGPCMLFECSLTGECRL